MNKLIDFLNKLEDAKIWHSIKKSMPDSIQVQVDVPGERWEVDFFFNNGAECSAIWIEKFKSVGASFEEEELEVLFRDFSD